MRLSAWELLCGRLPAQLVLLTEDPLAPFSIKNQLNTFTDYVKVLKLIQKGNEG